MIRFPDPVQGKAGSCIWRGERLISGFPPHQLIAQNTDRLAFLLQDPPLLVRVKEDREGNKDDQSQDKNREYSLGKEDSPFTNRLFQYGTAPVREAIQGCIESCLMRTYKFQAVKTVRAGR